MKERIYSIPLTDALNADCGCVMCALEEKLENDAVEYFMGASKMEPEIRIMTNKKGFCRRHLHMMEAAGSPLGLALMLDTHLEELRARLEKKGGRGGLFAAKKNAEAMQAIIDAGSEVYEPTDDEIAAFVEACQPVYDQMISEGICTADEMQQMKDIVAAAG